MKKRGWLIFIAVATTTWIGAYAFAFSSYLIQFNVRYGTIGSELDTCIVCHRNKAGGLPLNPYGKALKRSGFNFETIEPEDSDGDSSTNIAEINARTFPGNPASCPK